MSCLTEAPPKPGWGEHPVSGRPWSSSKAHTQPGHTALCHPELHRDLLLNLPSRLQENHTSYSFPLITHLENPNLFPPPFFWYYMEGYYGKTKHKPEYDAVGKHWDSSTECPRNSIRPMCLEKCYRSLRIKGFAFVVTWTALTTAP